MISSALWAGYAFSMHIPGSIDFKDYTVRCIRNDVWIGGENEDHEIDGSRSVT
jgi:hypothetical protein